ncbi:MAG: large repetitive protein, partial [Euryarchaeota archaeon]|nr:large repetitive protein [Euryarchaeota archaeon]
GPLFLQDIFPQEARFINATLLPNQLDQNCSNWTILHLAIGNTLIIGINLDVERCGGDIINRALVIGNCSKGQVTAQNISVIDRDYLGCCPPEEPLLGDDLAAPGIGCACGQDEAYNRTDFLDPAQMMMMQWESGDEADGSCPLSCSALVEGHASVHA